MQWRSKALCGFKSPSGGLTHFSSFLRTDSDEVWSESSRRSDISWLQDIIVRNQTTQVGLKRTKGVELSQKKSKMCFLSDAVLRNEFELHPLKTFFFFPSLLFLLFVAEGPIETENCSGPPDPSLWGFRSQKQEQMMKKTTMLHGLSESGLWF